ncbi:MAG: ADP-ribosylglycohydrolase family protein [Deltaproteobacteria bacterium]|nr:ADP-ribosylglycohydrolase family protein [Deltaproteobacteria bacterium]
MTPEQRKAGSPGVLEHLKARFKGSALGTFVGDALGRPVEGWSSQMIRAAYGLLGRMKEGVYTDDTEMMIGIMESLVESPRFDPELTSRRFLANFDPHRGYGGRIFGVMERLRCGVAWNEAGTDSWGNGGAMRIAPIGFFYYDLPGRLREAAHACTWITHQHPLGLAGGLAQAKAVALATLKGISREALERAEFVDTLSETVRSVSEDMARAIERVKEIRRGRDLRETIERIASRFPCDISALGAVPPALASFLLAESFRDTLVVAVNCGGDTDTIGAMAGALAGAYYGYGEIPCEWLGSLENGPKGRDYVASLAEKLAEIKSREAGQEARS